MGGEVVDGAADWGAIGEGVDVLGEEGVFEGVGVVEVLQGALVRLEMAEVAVVEVEGQERRVELGGEFFGEGGLAGAGAAGDAEDEGTARQGELLGS